MPETALPASAEVVVVGAGPVGLLLGAELHRRDVSTLVIERRPKGGGGSRAIGVHAPVLAALEASGITERMLAGAVRVPRGEARVDGRTVGAVRFDRLRVRFPFVATLPQARTEAAIGAGAPEAVRGVGVRALRREPRGMRVLTDDGEVRARVVVVAGGRAARELVFRPGAVRERIYPDPYLMADAALGDTDPVAVVSLGRGGVLESFPLPDGHRRFVTWDADPAVDDPDARRLRLAAALEAHGLPAAAAHLPAVSGFRVRRTVAPRLRRGRVLVVGDAAHEVSPIGGQGMNLGLLDAASLAPLLAVWMRTGEPPEAALDRWERRRVASARIAAAIATANTMLGRPLGPLAHAARRGFLRGALTSVGGLAFAHAYSMGLDRGA